MNILAGCYLFIQGIWDICFKKIPIWISIVFGGCSFIYSLYCHRNWRELCLACIPGILCLLLGYCTKEAVGYGDGILLCTLGMLYSIEIVISICMIAMLSAGIVGLILLTVFQKSGKYEIPFVPFLCFAWSMVYIGGI